MALIRMSRIRNNHPALAWGVRHNLCSHKRTGTHQLACVPFLCDHT